MFQKKLFKEKEKSDPNEVIETYLKELEEIDDDEEIDVPIYLSKISFRTGE